VTIRKILILRFSSLGDIVMTTAMVRAMRQRFPLARIDMVVREDFLDLIRENPHLDGKIGLPRGSGMKGLLELRSRLKKERYDLIYDAHRSLRTRFLVPLLPAEHKAYYPKHYLRRALALTFKLRILPRTRFLEKFIEPLLPFGVVYDGKGPEMYASAEARTTALQKVPVPQGRLVGVVPSAQWPGKRWPLDRFRATLEKLLATTNYAFVVLGGREDTFCTELCAGLPAARVVNAQGKLSLAESIAMVGECKLVIANDTGLMHVADAMGIPSVLFLGPTSAELGCLPFHPETKVLEHDLWCRPCSKNGQAPCIRKERFCLTLTSVDQTVAAARAIGSQA